MGIKTLAGWRALGLAGALLGMEMHALCEPETGSAERVIDYWVGEYTYSGKITKSGSLNLSGNTLNFNTGTSEPLGGTMKVTVWLHEDGIPRLKADDCTAALFPAKGQGNVTLETGGLFVEDLAYGGSPKKCLKNPGDEDVESWDRLTVTEEGIELTAKLVRKIKQPYAGKIETSGRGFLRPVYKKVVKPRTPAENAAWAAAESDGVITAAEGIKLRGLATTLDAVIRLDSNGWIMNRYDAESVFNEQILEMSADGQNGWLYGEYTYNGGNPGWVKVNLKDGDVNCVQFWDEGGCRKPGSGSAGAQLMMGLLVAGIVGGNAPSSGQEDGYPLDENEEFLLRKSMCNGDPNCH